MKKLLRILIWLAGIVLVLLIVAAIGLKLFFPAEKVKTMAVEKGSAALGREIAVEGLDISIWGGLGVELQKVRIANPDGFDDAAFLSADNVDLKLQLLPLITGDIKVDRLIIDAPVIHLMKNAEGAVNYAFQFADSAALLEQATELPAETQATALAISFDELEISDGHITFQDDSAGVRYELAGVDLATSLEYPRTGLYQSAGRLRADSVTVTMDEAYPPVAFDLTYRLDYDMTTGSLTVERAGVTINDLLLKVTGQLNGLNDNYAAELNVQSEQISVTSLLSLLPPPQRARLADYTVDGVFSLDADLSYDATADHPVWHYAGNAVLTDLVMTSRAVDGTLKFSRCAVDFKPDNLRMNIEDGSFDGQPFKGHLVIDDFENPRASAELAGSLDLALLEPFLPAESDHRVSGLAGFDLKLSGPVRDPENLSFSGDLRISNGHYNSSLVPEPVTRFDLDAYFDNRLLNVRELTCQFPSGRLDFTGRIADLVPYLLSDPTASGVVTPQIEATVKGGVDLAIAKPYLPEKGNPELTGMLSVDVGFAGNTGDLTSITTRGTVTITEASYSDSLLPEPVEQFEAALSLRPDTIEVRRLVARFTTSDVSFTGQLIRPFPYFLPIIDLQRDSLPKPLFLFELTSHRFDIDRLFPEAVPGSGSETAVVSTDSLSTIILPNIDGRGTAKADTIIYSQVELADVVAQVRIHDRRIECYDATAKVYTGTVAGKTTIDLSDFGNPHYSGEFNATQIEANDFVARFSKFGGHLYGKGNLSGNYNAHGWEPEAFLNSLTMDGDLDVRDGRLVTSGAVHSTLAELASQFGESFDEEQPLQGFTSGIAVKDGRVYTDTIRGVLGDFGDFVLDGSYGFDETLNYSGQIFFTRERLRKLGYKGSDRLGLPFSISGTRTSPAPSVDISGFVASLGKSLLKDKAQDLLKDLFKKK